MTSIFNQQLSEVGAGAAKFQTVTPTPVDIGGAIEQAGKIAGNIIGTQVKNRAERDIAAAQEEVILNRQQAQDLTSELASEAESFDQLAKDNPVEADIVRTASQRITKIQDALRLKTLSVSEGFARIEAIKRQAAASAPIFKNEILNIGSKTSGTANSAFDAVQAEILVQRKDMADIGLDFDKPEDRAEFQFIQNEERELMISNTFEKLSTQRADRLAAGHLSTSIRKSLGRFKVITEQGDQLDAQVAAQLASLTTDAGARAEVIRLLEEGMGSNAAFVSDDVIAKYSDLVKAQTSLQHDTITGKSKINLLENNITSTDLQTIADFQKDRKQLSAGIALIKHAGLQNTAAGTAVGGAMSDYLRSVVLAGLDGNAAPPPPGGDIVIDLNTNKKNALDSEEVDAIQASAATSQAIAKGILANVEDYTPRSASNLLNSLSNVDELQQVVDKLNADEKDQWLEDHATATRVIFADQIMRGVKADVASAISGRIRPDEFKIHLTGQGFEVRPTSTFEDTLGGLTQEELNQRVSGFRRLIGAVPKASEGRMSVLINLQETLNKRYQPHIKRAMLATRNIGQVLGSSITEEDSLNILLNRKGSGTEL